MPRAKRAAEEIFVSPTTGKNVNRPPLFTLLSEVVGWTMDRTADIPKSQRFTFGQRLDNLALDALLDTVKAIYSADARFKADCLGSVILGLEQSAVLWRLAQERRWISQQQLLHITSRLSEAGRMANGWRQQQARRRADATP
jgi:hypothetical protein